MKCCVCFKKTKGLLPCQHCVCLQCRETIYYSVSITERPIQFSEIVCPEWPLTDKHHDKYEAFRETWLDKKNSYVKLIKIRNNLKSIRPDWMETETFLKYKNELLLFEADCAKLEKAWKEYQENIDIHKICPLCTDYYLHGQIKVCKESLLS
uniref:RING-type domain-containing protein n=1 Tax=viral metagenome TaxID=1070528 RepID=A0A6C0HZE9_9ZZZZ